MEIAICAIIKSGGGRDITRVVVGNLDQEFVDFGTSGFFRSKLGRIFHDVGEIEIVGFGLVNQSFGFACDTLILAVADNVEVEVASG